jgi:hypothetical protein
VKKCLLFLRLVAVEVKFRGVCVVCAGTFVGFGVGCSVRLRVDGWLALRKTGLDGGVMFWEVW